MLFTKSCRIAHFSPFRHFSSSTTLKTIKLTDKPKFPLLKGNASLVHNSGLYNILLDNRLLLTPRGNVVSTPSSRLAELIKGEFEVKTNELTCFNDLPYTLLLSSALDLEPHDLLDKVNKLKEAINTDTVLFFQETLSPDPKLEVIPCLDSISDSKLASLRNFELEQVQAHFYLPVLRSFSVNFKVPQLVTSDSVSKIPLQHPDTLSFIHSFVHSLNPFQLVATFKVHENLKSVILTLLFLRELVPSARALRVSRIEETVQSAHWGVTDTFEAEEARIKAELERCLFFYQIYS